MILRAALSTLALALTLASCDRDAQSASPRALIDTLPSGVVRVRGPAEARWPDGSAWRIEEVVRIGAVEGDGPDVFGQIWAITTDAANRFYVLDRLAKEVRVFDSRGNHVRTFGREGAGPGEFTDPFGFAWDANGRLWVVDVRNSRYSVFDTTGTHAREYPRLVGGFSWPWPGKIARDGLLYEPSYLRDTRALIAFQPGQALTPADTFPNALLDLAPGDFWDLRDEKGIGAVVGIPFGRQSEWALDADAHIWTGHSGRYAIAYRTLEGDTVLLLERDVPPVAISAAERASAIEGVSEENRRNSKLDLSRIPQTKPFFRRLLPDDVGNLWVLREGEGSAWQFDVFDRDGFVGSVPISQKPSLFPPPRITRDMILLVTSDSLGVQSLVAYRIARGARAQ